MKRAVAWLWIGVAACSAGTLGIMGSMAVRVRTSVAVEVTAWRTTVDHARVLDELGRTPVQGEFTGSRATLAERISAALADAGLAGSILVNVSPESERTLDASGQMAVVRRRATLTLAPVSLPELGRVLDDWRQREPAWTISAIELHPETQREKIAGANLPLRAIITIEAIAAREPRP